MKLEGVKELDNILRDIAASDKKKGELAAMRKAAEPILQEVKDIMEPHVDGANGFSKLEILMTQIAKVTYKGGVNVQIKKNAVDIPVEGLRGRSAFTAFGWARLMAQGRQWTARTTAARKARWTGYTEGKGDFIDTAFDNVFMTAKNIFEKSLKAEYEKAMERSKKKYGGRG